MSGFRVEVTLGLRLFPVSWLLFLFLLLLLLLLSIIIIIIMSLLLLLVVTIVSGTAVVAFCQYQSYHTSYHSFLLRGHFLLHVLRTWHFGTYAQTGLPLPDEPCRRTCGRLGRKP